MTFRHTELLGSVCWLVTRLAQQGQDRRHPSMHLRLLGQVKLREDGTGVLFNCR